MIDENTLYLFLAIPTFSIVVFIILYYWSYEVIDQKQGYSLESICTGVCMRKGTGASLQSYDSGYEIKVTCKKHRSVPYKKTHYVELVYEIFGDYWLLNIPRKGTWRCTVSEENWDKPILFTLKRKLIGDVWGIYKHKLRLSF